MQLGSDDGSVVVSTSREKCGNLRHRMARTWRIVSFVSVGCGDTEIIVDAMLCPGDGASFVRG